MDKVCESNSFNKVTFQKKNAAIYGDQGLAIALNEFKKVLDEEGLEEISPGKGNKFDPKVHEVIETVEDGKHGEVAELVLAGWKFKDGMVIRPAKVKVYGERVEKKEELEKEMARGDYM